MFILFNVFFIIYFVFSAVVQYNDPDPYTWMPIYLYAGLLCFLAIKKIQSWLLYFPVLIIYPVFALYLFFSQDGVLSWLTNHNAESLVQSMQATKPWIEKSREFFGLLITITVHLFNFIWLRKKQFSSNPASVNVTNGPLPSSGKQV
jgi:hypothetical protein